jgi:predicted AAA+ superfamily ATPase
VKRYKRSLDILSSLRSSSCFLFGPRATGKTSLLKDQLKSSIYIDLLNADVYEELMRRPVALQEKIRESKNIVVIDEIQKLPKLLDEVHRLIEEKQIKFLLTGSSARKLRREGANMLGGRARELQLFPLTWNEIDDFDLIKYLNFGGLPIIYQSTQPKEDLKAYVRNYLAEEIKAEALVRNYERFVRFLEVMSTANGQELNYANLASDSGVPARTIESHIEVLKDTLMAYELLPFSKTSIRKAVSKSKFYFFDVGVANYLSERLPLSEGASDIGFSFEQFIINEVRAYLAYNRVDKKLSYWRSGKLEVDLIIGKELAVEIKFSKQMKSEFYIGLEALKEENIIKKYMIVGRFTSSGEKDGIKYLNYEKFLEQLWAGELV